MKEIEFRELQSLSEEQRAKLRELQMLCFPKLTEQTYKEDYHHPAALHIICLHEEQLIAWAAIHYSDIEFEGRALRLGGYGICTHPEWRHQGLARRLSALALEHLKDAKVDVAFHAVDMGEPSSIRFHEKKGFVIFRRPFSWTDIHGERKEKHGSMLMPMNSREDFEAILVGKDVLHVGQGYW